MIIRFTSNKTGRWRDVSNDRDYTRAILDLCGGGMNETQTARAMETLQELRDGNVCIRGDFTITNVT